MVAGIHPHDRTFSNPYLLELEVIMDLLTMNQAAKVLNVATQSLSYYYRRGRISGQKVGGVVLIDPTVAKKELEAAGYYDIREKRRNRKRSASTNE